MLIYNDIQRKNKNNINTHSRFMCWIVIGALYQFGKHFLNKVVSTINTMLSS